MDDQCAWSTSKQQVPNCSFPNPLDRGETKQDRRPRGAPLTERTTGSPTEIWFSFFYYFPIPLMMQRYISVGSKKKEKKKTICPGCRESRGVVLLNPDNFSFANQMDRGISSGRQSRRRHARAILHCPIVINQQIVSFFLSRKNTLGKNRPYLFVLLLCNTAAASTSTSLLMLVISQVELHKKGTRASVPCNAQEPP